MFTERRSNIVNTCIFWDLAVKLGRRRRDKINCRKKMKILMMEPSPANSIILCPGPGWCAWPRAGQIRGEQDQVRVRLSCVKLECKERKIKRL